MPDWMPIIVALVSVVISIFVAAREYRFGKPDALKKYEELVDSLLERVEDVELELESYRLGVMILIGQLQEIGVQPKWKPGEKMPKNVVSRPRSKPRGTNDR